MLVRLRYWRKKCWRNPQRKSHFDKGKFAAHQEKYGKRERKLKRVKNTFHKKKGWYTLCVTTTSGKKKLTHLYFEKKKYEITINQTVHKSVGYYYIASQEKKRACHGSEEFFSGRKCCGFSVDQRVTMPAVCGRLKVPAVKRFA